MILLYCMQQQLIFPLDEALRSVFVVTVPREAMVTVATVVIHNFDN